MAGGVLTTPDLAARSTESVSWAEVVASYEQVHDYTARYEKEERAIDDGAMQWIRLSFRKPLDVRMDWMERGGKVDQVAVYRQGYNDGKLVARKSGMLGSMIGTVHLDVHDKRALDDSRHPITEVGLGHIIEQATHAMREGQATSAGPAADTVDGAPAFRFELTRTGGGDALFGISGAARASIWVDASQKLPVKVLIVDGAGAMLERHRFKELRINVGLTDQTFTL
jgi:hypothetical protein